MTRKWMTGEFVPKYPQKYRGDGKITYRSSWERVVMNWLDLTPEVLAWESENTIIRYFDPVQQKARRYFCDFKVAVKSHSGKVDIWLIEIKPYRQTVRPRQGAKSDKTLTDEIRTWVTNQAKWDAAKALCKDNGWRFKVITEKEIYGGMDKGYKKPRAKKPKA